MATILARAARIMGRHYLMERFSAVMLAATLALAVVLAGAGASVFQQHRHALAETSVYTTKYTASRSGASGRVVGLETSPDHTRCALMVRYGDTALMPTDPDQYRLFVTAADVAGNTHAAPPAMDATTTVYGQSGLVVFTIHAQGGFANQILAVTVRHDKPLKTTSDGADQAGKWGDESFKTHDQYRLHVNPGATGVTESALPARMSASPMDAYRTAVEQPALQDANRQFETMSATMLDAMNQITEAERRAGKAGLTVPDRPAQIAGDQVVSLVDGTAIVMPGSITAGGYDLDWRSQDPVDTLDAFVADTPDADNDDQYFAKVAQIRAMADTGLDQPDDWTLQDGTRLADLRVQAVGNYDQLKQTVAGVQNAWNQYWQHKYAYQTSLSDTWLDVAAQHHTVEQSLDQASTRVTVY